MNHYLRYCLWPALITALLLLPVAGCQKGHDAEQDVAGVDTAAAGIQATVDADNPGNADLYTCAMHPHVLQHGPGTCPICGMDLTPVRSGEDAEGVIRIDPVTRQNIGVRTARVQVRPLQRQIHTSGRFEMDESGAHNVALKVAGWVEDLFVDFDGAIVQRGQPLLDLYSPELVSTQEEYLLALSNVARIASLSVPSAETDARKLLEAARRRLAYWDLSAEQIQALEDSGEPQRTIRFFAPASGEVMYKAVTRGQYVRAGESLMQIFDQSRIWLIADLYEQDLGWVAAGARARVTLPYDADAAYEGRVEHIYYMLNEDTRTAKARIVLPGRRDKLRPGMFAEVEIKSTPEPSRPVVPEEAVLRYDDRAVVILDLGDGAFRPHNVHLGVQADGMYQILEGLEGGEVIVTSTQFLLDSETRLRSAVNAMTTAHDHGSAAPAPRKQTPRTTASARPGDRTAVDKTDRLDLYAIDADGDGSVFVCFEAPSRISDSASDNLQCPGTPSEMPIGAAIAMLHDEGFANIPVSVTIADVNGDGVVYQSFMHWSVMKDAPGNCDVCNMYLERVSVQDARQNLVREGFQLRDNEY